MHRLGTHTLTELNAGVRIPSYDRRSLTQGIAHIGVGNFHRAHEALAIDDLLSQDSSAPWAICGIALLSTDEPLARKMQAQDCLYTLVEKHASGMWDTRIIGSITELLYAPDDPEAVIIKLCVPNIKVVSLTITEGGYNVDPITGAFLSDAAPIRADLEAPIPSTVFGFVTEALKRRRDAGIDPFTVMSCDNIQHNGDIARRSFSSYASLRDRELGEWIRSSVAFPNSMVDRITPVTTPEDIRRVNEIIGVSDECPVVCEPFFQWVIEEDFPHGRPALEQVRAQMVEDVTP